MDPDLKVENYEPPLRFLVKSAKFADRQYLVDLGEYEGHGRCDCPHFRCKLEGEIQTGKRGKDYRCKHIRAAREVLADGFIRVCLQKEEQ
jgi:hypothetical protein